MRSDLDNNHDIAVFTTKYVLEENKPITYVTHEIEDGAWQFLSDDHFDDFEDVAKIVGFQELIDIDPTLAELISMDVGCVATRKHLNDNWIIRKI